jgi:anti-sigma factor RsiW
VPADAIASNVPVATEATAIGEKASVSHGYNLIRWSSGGIAYWVVSDLNLAEVQQFALLLQEQTSSTIFKPSTGTICAHRRLT